MRTMAVLTLVVSLCLGGLARAAEGPLELAGIRLGDSESQAAARLRPEAADRECRRSGLALVPTAPLAGYHSGYVDVGQCAKPGRITRIKMRYRDDSLEFFNKILSALKKRYGEPTQWRGNAFGTLRAWKWSLTAADGTKVSLLLMHYAGDDDAFTQGNSIRLAASDLVREEARCQAAAAGADPGGQERLSAAPAQTLGLDWFLPH